MVFKNMLFEVLESIRKLLELPVIIIGYIKGWLHFRRLAKKFPGPPSLPILGNLLDMGFPITATRVMSYVVDKMQHYNAGQMSLGPSRIFFLCDPRDVQCYLLNPGNQLKPPFEYGCLADIMGNGLATENGSLWKRHNKILLPTFHKDRLHNQMSVCNRKCDVFVEVLSEHANGVSFDIRPLTEFVTMDIARESISEVPSDFLRSHDHTFFEAINRAQEILAHRLGHPWLMPNCIFYTFSSLGNELKRCKEIYRAHCEEAIRYRENVLDEEDKLKQNGEEQDGKKKRYGVLDTMILHMRKGELTRQEVTDETVTNLAAGFDTTYASILFSFYLLAKHPDVQEKVFAEIQDVFNETGSTELTLDVLQRMQYLEMVIKECLRLYPSIWVYLRLTGVDTPLVSSDLVVPAGAVVAFSPKSMHMNPKLFSDPETFYPERFSEENSVNRHPYAFLTFSLGKRACIGRRYAWMKIKAIVCKVIWNFQVLPDPDYTPTVVWGVSTVPSNGMWVKLLKRDRA